MSLTLTYRGIASHCLPTLRRPIHQLVEQGFVLFVDSPWFWYWSWAMGLKCTSTLHFGLGVGLFGWGVLVRGVGLLG